MDDLNTKNIYMDNQSVFKVRLPFKKKKQTTY